MTTANGAMAGSFRDPSGFVFSHNDEIYRQINLRYRDDYEQLTSSGLLEKLVGEGLLVAHDEVNPAGLAPVEPHLLYKVIRPERVPFVSYPYEWSFSQLRDAALLTLRIQTIAIEHGMSLKDCSVYNVVVHRGRPLFIDTLSFERYREGEPWVAYRQFCQHFLAPLALMSYKDVRLSSLFRAFIDGVPLDLASTLLPFRTRLKFPLLSHIHLHARSQRRYADETNAKKRVAGRKVSKMAFRGLIDNLQSAVKSLRWRPGGTEWGDYYDDTNYSDDAMDAKAELVRSFVQEVAPSSVWDLGANTGVFSRIAAEGGAQAVAFDIDPAAVEKNYLRVRDTGEANILPLVIDLTNPTPAIGWHHQERESLVDRGPVDLVLALALIHHLAISNNLPFEKIAKFLADLTPNLIIEFVPKGDSQVDRLLATREDVFPTYHEDGFEAAFAPTFDVVRKEPVAHSKRTMYLMQRRS